MYSRVRKYFKLKFPELDKKDIYKILMTLFKETNNNEKFDEYLRVFKKEFDLDENFKFFDIETRWWKYSRGILF